MITGAQGQLGRECVRRFAEHDDISIVGADIEDFDLMNDSRRIFEYIGDVNPDVVLHAGAYTDVERAEDNPDMAWEINAEGTKKVANAVKTIKGRMIYISTDYVFNGEKSTPYTEEDTPDPQSVYARSKYRGEVYLRETLDDHCIVRSSWLYSHLPQSFVSKILKTARRDGELRVVNDQVGTPTYVKDLASALVPLVKSDETGVFHITNGGQTTWYGFAVEIVETMGLDVEVIPVKTDDLNLRAERPRYSVLSNERFEETFGIKMRDWRLALEDFIGEHSDRIR